jgi:hypothetical protein
MSWIDTQEKYTLTSDRVRVNHTNAKNVIQYVINPSYYFKEDVLTQSWLSFRTLTLTEEELNFHTGEDGGSSKKRIQIIYAVNEFKNHEYFRTHKRLIPFEYLKKGEIEKRCCNCLRQIPEINNDFDGRKCCKSCWINPLREVGINLNLCEWKQ